MFKLYLNLSNVKMTYSNAYGEFSANKQLLKILLFNNIFNRTNHIFIK